MHKAKFARAFRRLAAACGLGLFLLVAAGPQWLPTGSPVAEAAASRDSRIILLRGFMSVFSLGMDDLGKELRGMGYSAESHGHLAWPELARDIDRQYHATGRYPRLVIIGHSLGANDAVRMANWLGRQSIPVALVITYDPTERLTVGPTVRRTINYYLPRGIGKPLNQADGARGRLVNRDIDDMPRTGHLNMDYNGQLWRDTVGEIRRALR